MAWHAGVVAAFWRSHDVCRDKTQGVQDMHEDVRPLGKRVGRAIVFSVSVVRRGAFSIVIPCLRERFYAILARLYVETIP